MAGTTPSGDDEIISGINVTPLVDVVLVLLIIFIVTASFILRSSIPMQLPQASTAEESASGLLTVAIAKEKGADPYRLYFNGRPGTIDDLPRVVGEARGKLPEGQTSLRVFISADVGAAYGRFAEVVDRLRREGVTEIAMDTQPVEIEEPPE